MVSPLQQISGYDGQGMGVGPTRLPAGDEENGYAAHRRQPQLFAQRAATVQPVHRSHVQDRRRPRSRKCTRATTKQGASGTRQPISKET